MRVAGFGDPTDGSHNDISMNPQLEYDVRTCNLADHNVGSTSSISGFDVPSTYILNFKYDGCDSDEYDSWSYLQVVLDVTITSTGHQV